MTPLRIMNASVSFLMELALAWLLAVAGFNTATASLQRIVLAILFPLVAIGIWAVFLAPNSRRRFGQPWLALTKILLFTIAALVAYRFTDRWGIYLFLGLGYASSLLALWTEP